MKTCTKCGCEKPVTEFHKCAATRDGLHRWCKACAASNGNKWRGSNSERKKANDAKWRTANIERKKASDAARYAANRKKERARLAKWSVDNPEKMRASREKWNAANPDRNRESKAAWQAANPEARRIGAHNRRARKRANGGRLSPDLTTRLFKLQRGKCSCCHASLDDGNHLDHVIPVALGGPNEDWNMQLLCIPCNLSKGAKHPIEFMQQRGFLL